MAIDGTYNIQIDTPMGTQTATLTLKTDGNALSGSMSSGMVGTSEFSGGTVDGDNITWRMKIDTPMGEMDLEYKGKISGDDISGEVAIGSFGTSPFRGNRA
jgi:hypothetical protein